jgi:hypothetical protein
MTLITSLRFLKTPSLHIHTHARSHTVVYLNMYKLGKGEFVKKKKKKQKKVFIPKRQLRYYKKSS